MKRWNLIALLLLMICLSAGAEGKLQITEAVSCNTKLNKRTSQACDLLEIMNTGDESVQLADYYLSDDIGKKLMWQLPKKNLKPGECYIVYCSGNGDGDANFTLSADGETVFLSDAQGETVDSMYIPALRANESYGVYEGSYYYYDTPTMGKKNGAGMRGVSTVPCISVPSGLHSESFTVTLSGEGDIYYTLDGSKPTKKSKKYEGGEIAITSTCALRAVAVQEDCLISDCVTAQYGFDMEKYQLPSLMIAGNQEKILGESGIYKNYSDRSLEAEINLVLIENGEECFNIDCGLKIHGAGSRKYPKKSFHVLFRARYGEDELKYKLFENSDVDTFTSLVFRSGSEDQKRSLFRDELLGALTRDSMPSVLFMDYKAVNLFINGKYYGIYFIRERIDEQFVENYLGGDKDDVDIINSWTDTEAGSIEDLKKLVNFCHNNDLRDEENYRYVTEQISVESFIDFYIARIYTGDQDFGNIRLCRSRKGDNKWYVINYDLDWGFFNSKNSLKVMLGSEKYTNAFNNVIIYNLLKNKEFKDQFLTRLGMHLATTYQTERVENEIESMVSLIGGDIVYNQARWQQKMSTWEEYVQLMRDYVSDDKGTRVQELVTEAKSFFSLTDEEMEKYFGTLWSKGE